MTQTRIINCHTHSFTLSHVPSEYPFHYAKHFKRRPKLTRWVARVARWFLDSDEEERLDRLLRFQEEGNQRRQRDILDSVMRHYPGSTRFVVLPMDMELSGYGEAEENIEAQHRELYDLTKLDRYKGRVIPFASVHPDRPGAFEIIRRAVDDYGFRGLKIYPKLGYAPDHPVLMQQIYPFIVGRGLPVMTHCSRGGFKHLKWTQDQADAVTRPQAYINVMKEFPEMRLCLAHFGGQQDWADYVNEGYDPDDPKAEENNWQMAIRGMITSGDYPNLYTDISYTIFHFAEFIPFLRLFLRGDDQGTKRLRERVLFGSDFYMTRQEEMSERAVCFSLRNDLGEDTFRQIADLNPNRWLTG